MGEGSTMLTRPKKPTETRNIPGIHEESRRGEVKNFSHIPNRKRKRGMAVCFSALRRPFPSLGKPGPRPHPYQGKLDPRPPIGRKRGTFTLEENIPEACPGITTTDPDVQVCPKSESENADSATSPPVSESLADHGSRYQITAVGPKRTTFGRATMRNMIRHQMR